MMGTVVWFTGLSGSGKSTIAAGVCAELTKRGKKVKIIDGDEIRKSCHHQLRFTPEDIRKNNRLVAEMCRTQQRDYDYILVALISPFSDSRAKARDIIGKEFIEVYVKAEMDTLISRDCKGLYKKALNGQIENFIGLSPAVPYEPPQNPEIFIDTEDMNPHDSVSYTLKTLSRYLSARPSCDVLEPDKNSRT